ncbi:4755_t:CDS:2, partial [Cetraspora pellucida]
AKATKPLEVYTKKMRQQMKKGRKHLQKFELNNLVQNDTYILGYQYGRLNKHYLAIKLISIAGTFSKYSELINISNTCVNAHKAAIQQSS